MIKKRKKIGVITSEIYDSYRRKLLLGIQEEAYARDYDVLVFSTFVKGQMWNAYQTGEMNIFSIINYEKLDGIVLIPDKLTEFKEAADNLERLYAQYPDKVVSIGYQVEGITSIMDDTRQSFRAVLEHLYGVHGVRDIACLTGKKGHPHAEERLQAYYSFMKDKDLPIRENRVFYGDFWYDSGDEVVDALLQSPEGLPQAICCASDTMGLSVYDACAKRNIRVPEDVLITGFDADGGGVVKPYFMTSACRDARTMGINATRRLINQLEGEELPEKPIEEQLVLGRTCGCMEWLQNKTKPLNISELRDDIYNNFFSEYNFMMEDGTGAQGIVECLWKIDWYLLYIREHAGYYICLCEDWNGEDQPEVDLHKQGYSDRMNLIYSKYRDTKSVDEKRFYDRTEMLPAIWEERDVPSTFCFTPLHFMGRCFGYGVVQYEEKPNIFPTYYWSFIRNVCNLLETMRRYINMERVNSQLIEAYRLVERNAVTDSLTGLFNRNGFNQYAKEQMALAEREGRQLVVLMADLNDLKHINDTFGHAEGDFAIQHAGNAVKQFLQEDNAEYEKCYRIGGDEYTIVCVGDFTDEEIALRRERIESYLKHINAVSGKPYRISVSLGISREEPKGRNLDQVILKADKLMYADKRRIKGEMAAHE
ncbi:MAG: GGDEF domain-containing protein [Lachnospiraceae bacterium]